MKKVILSIVITMVFAFTMNAQLENKNGVYTEVIQVDLSKKDIYQKVNEWIAINYKSAQDVVQLNTEDKVIVKGNYIVVMGTKPHRVHNSLSFAIRDNRYKVDLIANSISVSTYEISDAKSEQVVELYSPKKIDKDVYHKITQENGVANLKSLGWSDKKIKKKFLDKPYDDYSYYSRYLENKKNWDKAIESTFQSIKNYISQSDSGDDW